MQVGMKGSVGKFRPEQIATQKTWDRVPDGDTTFAAMHVIHVVPKDNTTVTRVNPVDPGDGFYVHIPSPDSAKVVPARRI